MSLSTRRLQVESLEKRELMAGNVSVYFYQNDLYIVGDANANGVQIVQKSPGSYDITGQFIGGANTKINGYSGVLARGIARDVKISLGNGNDLLDIGNGNGVVTSVPNTLMIDMGTGNDSAYLRDVTVGNTLSIATGSGVDKTVVQSTRVNNNLLIGDGAGYGLNTGDRDEVSLNVCNIRNQAAFTFGRGNDSVDVNSTVADSIYADLGDGNDYFKMTFSRARGFTANGGRGTDTFFVPDYAGTRYNGSNFETIRRG